MKTRASAGSTKQCVLLLIREMRQACIVTVHLMHERACHEPQHLCADQLKIMRQNQLLSSVIGHL